MVLDGRELKLKVPLLEDPAGFLLVDLAGGRGAECRQQRKVEKVVVL